jgi:hypothetical protein
VNFDEGSAAPTGLLRIVAVVAAIAGAVCAAIGLNFGLTGRSLANGVFGAIAMPVVILTAAPVILSLRASMPDGDIFGWALRHVPLPLIGLVIAALALSLWMFWCIVKTDTTLSLAAQPGDPWIGFSGYFHWLSCALAVGMLRQRGNT